ncbi:YaaC family protein [Burkholderia gladioli]|uniref:YaaC family protein n=1 Tax=Burkholderia gladioli TaxID=28095 RepID=UPI00163FFF0C|nr:hypothetical protein [Burkholderia gladioli]
MFDAAFKASSVRSSLIACVLSKSSTEFVMVSIGVTIGLATSVLHHDKGSRMDKQRTERIVAADPIGATRLRLNRLMSHRLCADAIVARNNTPIDPDVLEKKAQGMAWAVRSGLGYWEAEGGGLNSRVLSRYYAMLQLSIAEQVGSADDKDLLPAIQRHTEFGHGLFTSRNTNGQFPDGLVVGCTQSGHFTSYAKYLGIDLTPFIFTKKPKNFAALDSEGLAKVVSLTDLLLRVPELQTSARALLGRPALSVHVGHSGKNMKLRLERTQAHIKQTGAFTYADPGLPGEMDETWLCIYPPSVGDPTPIIDAFGLPFTDVQEETDNEGRTSLSVLFMHPKGKHWHECLKTYKSAYCGTSLIAPFWGIDDPFVLHFVILYAFSIVVRYLPELWHEIEDGPLDHLRSLLDEYLVILDHVMPEMIVERLTGVELVVTAPGSLFAPT